MGFFDNDNTTLDQFTLAMLGGGSNDYGNRPSPNLVAQMLGQASRVENTPPPTPDPQGPSSFNDRWADVNAAQGRQFIPQSGLQPVSPGAMDAWRAGVDQDNGGPPSALANTPTGPGMAGVGPQLGAAGGQGAMPPGGIPMPQPRPPQAPQPQTAANFPQDVNPNGPFNAGPVGPPTQLAPPMWGPGQPTTPPPGAPQGGGGLASMLGINLSPERKAQLASSLAAGLSNAGKNWNNPSKFGAVMQGAGAAMEGGIARGDKDREFGLKANAQNFNQLSTTFRNLMALRSTDQKELYNQAHADYWEARANALANGTVGANGKVQWNQTPEGKVINTNREVQKFFDTESKVLRDQWKLNGTPEDQQNKQLEDLRKRTNDLREKMYRQLGITADDAKKIETLGQTKENPRDTQGMTMQQFDAMVPLGGWYKYNGKVYQRTKPPAAAPQSPMQREDQENQQVPASPPRQYRQAEADLSEEGSE